MSDNDRTEPDLSPTAAQPAATPGLPPPSPPGYAYPPPAGPGYGYVPPPPEQRGTNGLAIAALVLGILAVVPLSIIFGIIALRQIRRTGDAGKGMAIAGLILSVLWIGVIVLVVTLNLGSRAGRDESGTITDGGSIPVEDVEVGDCLNGLQEAEVVFTVDAIACSAPHEAEVYAAIEMAGEEWPGTDEVTGQAEQLCADDLATSHPTAYEDQSVEIFFLHPTAASWRQGDREVNCIALYAEPRSGSLTE